MRNRILVTGGCGFVGHHMVEYLLQNNDCDVVILDRLDVSGNLNISNNLQVNKGVSPYYVEVPDDNINSPYNKKCAFCWNILDNI